MTDPNPSDHAFRALADPTRRAIVALLAERDMTIGDVAANFAMTRPAVAKHLRILEAGAVIRVEARGRERINRLDPAGLAAVRHWIEEIDRFWSARLGQLKDAIEAEDNDG